jgi:hypothetical protein
VKGWLAAALLALPLLAQAVPARESDEAVLATKAAMDAFFALDGTIPRVPAPDEPAELLPATDDHEALIETLAGYLAEGARLDRYRWGGTLLHHSLRAGFSDVTRWLIGHGADPLQKVEGDLDALGVAVRLQRWAEVRLLLKHPAYRRMPADDVGRRLWAGPETDEQRQTLLGLKLGLPRPAVANPVALATALHARDAATVDRLLAGRADRVAVDYSPVRASEPRLPENWPIQRWRQLDARLKDPVLPWALERAGSEAEVRTLLAAGLRARWADPSFSAVVARALPTAALPGLLLDPPRGTDVRLLWGSVSGERGSELRDLPADRWRAYVLAAPSVDIVMKSLDLAAGSGLRERARQPEATQADAVAWQARWEPLVERLRALPDARRRELWADPNWRLVHKVRELPPAFVPEFIAWAAAADALPDALPNFVLSLQPRDYDAFWAALQQQAPEVAGDLLPALLSRLWVDPPRSRLADRMTGWEAGDVALARWLLPRSPRVTPHPLRAAFGWRDTDLAQWAVAEGLALRAEPMKASATRKTPEGPVELRAVTEPLDCVIAVSPGLRRALAQLTLQLDSWVYGQEKLGWLQPAAAPGMAQCQWLRSSEVVTGGSWSDESFFYGFATHMAGGTIEQTLNVERWDEAAQRFSDPQGFSFTTQLLEVELAPGGERFWLGTESNANGRRGPSGYALSWQADKPVFEGLPTGAALDDRWRSLINPEKDGDAFDLDVEGPRQPVAVASFVDHHWSDEKQRFLAAFAALDRDALSAQRRAGLFAPWLNEAVQALSADAQQPLEARRRRMAWLLATAAFASALTDETLTSLRNWLPAEDWGPILARRRCSRYSVFADSREYGARQSSDWSNRAPPALRRRIEVALARDCDGEVQ